MLVDGKGVIIAVVEVNDRIAFEGVVAVVTGEWVTLAGGVGVWLDSCDEVVDAVVDIDNRIELLVVAELVVVAIALIIAVVVVAIFVGRIVVVVVVDDEGGDPAC